MTIYIMMHEDRHADTEVIPYLDRGAVLSAAKNRLNQFDRFKDARIETITKGMSSCGMIWRGSYGESNYITVFEKEAE